MNEWNKERSMGLSIIDEEHKKIVEIIDEIIAAKQCDNFSEKIKAILRKMIDSAWSQFMTEESYMIEFNYPEYQSHKEEHYDFVNRMNSYFDRVASGSYQLANEVLEYVKQWLVRHIEGTDRKYVECFARHGLT